MIKINSKKLIVLIAIMVAIMPKVSNAQPFFKYLGPTLTDGTSAPFIVGPYTTDNLGINGYYSFERGFSIYTPDELGTTPMLITHIAYYFGPYGTTSLPSGGNRALFYKLSDPTDLAYTTFPTATGNISTGATVSNTASDVSSVLSLGFTQFFPFTSGTTAPINETGGNKWIVFELPVPFVYNGNQTLHIAEILNNSNYTNSYLLWGTYSDNSSSYKRIVAYGNTAASLSVQWPANTGIGAPPGYKHCLRLTWSYADGEIFLNSNMGDVTTYGAGQYQIMSTITIRATNTDNCYEFRSWTDNDGNIISTDNPAQITLTGVDTTLTANYEMRRFNLSLSTTDAGVVTPAQTVIHNCSTVVNVSVSPNNCYVFRNWTNSSGSIISTEPSFDITLTSDTLLIANYNFEAKEVTYVINTSEGGVAELSTSSTRYCGNAVTYSATPDACYLFGGWLNESGEIVSTENPLDVMLLSDTILTAKFDFNTSKQAEIRITSTAGGSVEPFVGTSDQYCGDAITLTAVPESGFSFRHWVDNNNRVISTNEIIEVTLIGDSTLNARFTVGTKLVLESDPPGAEFVGEGHYPINTVVPIDAYFPQEVGCNTFKYWTDKDGNIVDTLNQIEVTIEGEENIVLTAHFRHHQVTLIANEGGAIEPIPGSDNIIEVPCNIMTATTLEAIPDANYTFKNWTDENNVIITTNNVLELIITNDFTFIANFEKTAEDTNNYEEFIVELVSNPDEAGILTGSGTYRTGEIAVIFAEPNHELIDKEYEFVNWTNTDGILISELNSIEIIVISDTVLVANFQEKAPTEFIVFVYSEPAYRGNVTGVATGSMHNFGAELNLKAIPNDDELWIFNRWTSLDYTETLGTLDEFTLIVRSDTTIVAHFDTNLSILENDLYDISIVPNPADKDFSVIFDNPEEQEISISILDISGRPMFYIYEGLAPIGKQIYRVDKKLTSGTYFINFMINDNMILRKLIIK